jgi:hypothetical protein
VEKIRLALSTELNLRASENPEKGVGFPPGVYPTSLAMNSVSSIRNVVWNISSSVPACEYL